MKITKPLEVGDILTPSNEVVLDIKAYYYDQKYETYVIVLITNINDELLCDINESIFHGHIFVSILPSKFIISENAIKLSKSEFYKRAVNWNLT